MAKASTLAYLDELTAELDDDGLVVVTADRSGFILTKPEALAFAAELVEAASEPVVMDRSRLGVSTTLATSCEA